MNQAFSITAMCSTAAGCSRMELPVILTYTNADRTFDQLRDRSTPGLNLHHMKYNDDTLNVGTVLQSCKSPTSRATMPETKLVYR